MKKKMLNIGFILLISFIFIDIVNAETYNNYSDAVTKCGNGLVTGIPTSLPKVISIIYTFIQVAVPIVLVVVGSIDLFKGITAQKEDEISKGRQVFIKRLITAAIIFFVFAVVKIVVSFAADSKNDSKKIINCMECFIHNNCG